MTNLEEATNVATIVACAIVVGKLAMNYRLITSPVTDLPP